MPRTPTTRRPHHAVVIGAGLGGLTIAQALSRHCERVTLVERDDLPGRPAHRSALPPSPAVGRHLHLLPPGGLAALERLLPGVGSELVAEGAVRLDAPGDVCGLSSAGWGHPFEEDQGRLLSATHDLVEWVTRQLVLDTPQVIVRSGLEATGLVVDKPAVPGATGRVRAVEVRPRGAPTAGPAAGRTAAPTEPIAADLVVDASGRRSRAPDWLADAGYARPAETAVDADRAHATRTYRRRPDDLGPWKAAVLQAGPSHGRRAGLLFPIERDRWLLSIAGTGGDLPPTSEGGFRSFVRGLRPATIADAIDGLEPLSPVVVHRDTEDRRRHYESLPLPDGFVVVGDAARAVDPIDGQGTSVSARTAEALDRCLGDHLARHGTVAGASARAQQAVALVSRRVGEPADSPPIGWSSRPVVRLPQPAQP